MIETVLMIILELQKWNEFMIIDIGDPAHWVSDRNISKVSMKVGVRRLDDSECLGGNIFDRIVPVPHQLDDEAVSIRA